MWTEGQRRTVKEVCSLQHHAAVRILIINAIYKDIFLLFTFSLCLLRDDCTE